MKLLHKIIFWTHLLAGVVAGLVIFIMSFTGVILMYEPQIAEYSEWNQRWVTVPGPAANRLDLDALVAKVMAANPGSRPAAITVKSDPAAAVIVNLGRENTVFVDPYTGELLGGLSATHHFMHDIVQWHRWLGMEEEGRDIGKAITGACNLAFFWLAVTGVYLWWPQSWKWRGLKTSVIFNFRLTGKARDWNWHNVIGFWSSSVLVVLTLTAAVMSYPWANDLLYTLTGSEPPPRAQRPQGLAQRAARGSSSNEEKPAVSVAALLAAAQRQVPGWTTLMMRFPPRPNAPVSVSVVEPDAPHPFARSQLTLNRATADVVKWEPYSDNSSGRKLRSWFRGLHTGEALGFFGQTVAGLASLGGCFLVWTGLAMAWRRFRSWRRTPVEIAVTAELPYIAQAPDTPRVTDSGPARFTAAEPQGNESQPKPANGHSVNTSGSEMISGYESITVLYGTVMGNAESVAHQAAASLRRAGFSVRVNDMAYCQASVLTRLGSVLIVTSTYGNGEPPDDIVPFWQAVVHGNGLDLRGLRFSVLALGNTTYDHFCQCGREFDRALERHGAARLHPRVDCDVDYEAPAMRWIDGVVRALQRHQAASVWAHQERNWPELESAS